MGRQRTPPAEMAKAKLTGAAFRTAGDDEPGVFDELRSLAAEAGDRATQAQVCADSADFYRRRVEESGPDLIDQRWIIATERLQYLADNIAGHSVAPGPRKPPLLTGEVPAWKRS